MSLPKPSAKIWLDYDKKKVMLSAPYSQDFNKFVRNIPRFFNKETKVWEFEIEFAEELVDIAFRVWTNVIRPPFLLIEIFEYLTKDDLKDMYEHLSKRHRSDEDKTLLTLITKFFGGYIDLTEIMRKKRMIRLEITNTPDISSDILSSALEVRSRHPNPIRLQSEQSVIDDDIARFVLDNTNEIFLRLDTMPEDTQEDE